MPTPIVCPGYRQPIRAEIAPAGVETECQCADLWCGPSSEVERRIFAHRDAARWVSSRE